MRLRLPFSKRAGQVLGDGSAQLRDLHQLVVMLIEEVSGKVLAKSALGGKGDHGCLPIALSSAALICESSEVAASMASAWVADRYRGRRAALIPPEFEQPERVIARAISPPVAGRRD